MSDCLLQSVRFHALVEVYASIFCPPFSQYMVLGYWSLYQANIESPEENLSHNVTYEAYFWTVGGSKSV